MTPSPSVEAPVAETAVIEDAESDAIAEEPAEAPFDLAAFHEYQLAW